VTPPAHRGFGSRLIERSIAGELSGRVQLEYLPGGLAADLTFPIDAAALEESLPDGLAIAV
jgi:two-component sensor histidine kinase